MITLPTPQCVVFYNGLEEITDEETMQLSAAFANKEVEPALELTVQVININLGHNSKLMEACNMLEQYAKFVQVTREYSKRETNQTKAMNAAIDYCIGHNILADILRRNRSEILDHYCMNLMRKNIKEQ